MADANAKIHAALARIRRSTVDGLAKEPKVARMAACILQDIDVVESTLRTLTEQLVMDNPRAGKPRKAAVVSHYTVEPMPSQGGDALTEHRKTGAQPFRCPKDIYDAAAEVLGGSMAPMKFDQVQSGVERLLRREIPIYQVRLVMRFWSVQGLLQHRRARFMAKAPKDLKAESTQLFMDLAKQSNPSRRGR